MKRLRFLSILVVSSALTAGCTAKDTSKAEIPAELQSYSVATFAGGCFWCVEKPFEDLDGVQAVFSGYTGGKEIDPSYTEVAYGRTGHTESVQIYSDPEKISYDELLDVYWRQIDPTDLGGQFVDRGKQYRPEIFVHDAAQRTAAEKSKNALEESGRFEEPIVVPITDAETFYPAEEYHQDFYKKSPSRYNSYLNGSGRKEFLKRYWD
jgi:peptide methionine sulfoxide reductase msrA/msrB